MTFRNILVPLDGSPHSEYALSYAVAIAAKCGAVLHAVLVHEPDAYSDYAGAHVEDYEQDAKLQEAAYLANLAKKLGDTLEGRLEVHHLEGVVQETLVAEVNERDADLVVMNAHGWGYISRALMGSVSDYLLRNLQVPLLLMHSEAVGTQSNGPAALGRVLIPMDGSDLAAAVLEPAQALGRLWNSAYRLVRVVSPPRLFAGWVSGEAGADVSKLLEKPDAEARSYLETVAATLRDQAQTVATKVLHHRKVAAAILHEAGSADCDLIAISTHGRGGLSRLFVGSVADKVVRGAEMPVLVYQPKLD